MGSGAKVVTEQSDCLAVSLTRNDELQGIESILYI